MTVLGTKKAAEAARNHSNKKNVMCSAKKNVSVVGKTGTWPLPCKVIFLLFTISYYKNDLP